MGKIAHMPQPPGVPWNSFEFWAEPLTEMRLQYGAVVHVRNLKTGLEATKRLEWSLFALYAEDARGLSLIGLVFEMMGDTYPPEVRKS